VSSAVLAVALWKNGDLLAEDRTLVLLGKSEQSRLRFQGWPELDWPRSVWDVAFEWQAPDPVLSGGTPWSGWYPFRVALCVNGSYLTEFVPAMLYGRAWSVYTTIPLVSRARSDEPALAGVYVLGVRVDRELE
jgi:hypothetical protein